MTTQRPVTAALVLIGDELLTAKVDDTNGRHAIRAMREAGIALHELVYVRDDVPRLAATVRRLAEETDIVITSGGIGPTHDDRTVEAVAAAFDVPLVENEELAERIRRVAKGRPERLKAFARLALLPEGASFVDDESLRWPVYLARNVYMLPGLPDLFVAQLPVVLDRHRGARARCVTLYLTWGEGRLVEPLDAVVEAWPDVAFGSYPVMNADYRTRVTVESVDAARVDRAVSDLLAQIDDDALVRIEREGDSTDGAG